jgi:hypothetical protein
MQVANTESSGADYKLFESLHLPSIVSRHITIRVGPFHIA